MSRQLGSLKKMWEAPGLLDSETLQVPRQKTKTCQMPCPVYKVPSKSRVACVKPGLLSMYCGVVSRLVIMHIVPSRVFECISRDVTLTEVDSPTNQW